MLIVVGIAVLVAGSLLAVSAVIRQVTRTVVSAEMPDRSGIPKNAKLGDCLKAGKNTEHEIVACTDPDAIQRITHVFTDMTMAAFNARMANGGDICPEGERTTAYSEEDDNAKATVYCLAWAATAAASQHANAEADDVSSPVVDFYQTAKVNDCVTGGTYTDYKVVPCADATAAWKITKKAVATRAELDSESPDNSRCAQNEVMVSHWSSEHSEAQANVFCLVRTR
ncbi:LppU/SCO3897 family protein [Nonomuraea basaltis]|uniref:LppU/SCO3897 family protein n=1 Tax=Nonomuraea basaltis TaxID=2495887 RepID=UPI00110C4D42|nr:hypothetical protein [Nonomuraea basaltis]TMR93574.1 hypothetical protein EJK15_38400 [Nonomuraea basaltis]